MESLLGDIAGPWVQEDGYTVKNISTGQEIEVGDIIGNYVATGSDYTGNWKVLGAKGGQILLMTASDVTSNFTISGREAYLTAIDDLDKECEGLDGGTYAVSGSARSIRMEDINRVTGWEPSTTNTITDNGNLVTYTMGADGTTLSWTVEGTTAYDGSATNKTFLKVEDGEALAANETYRMALKNNNQGYGVATALGGGNTSKAIKTFCMNGSGNVVSYWIATEYIKAEAGIATWGLHALEIGNAGIKGIFGSAVGNIVTSYSYGVRGVIALQSDVTFTAGDVIETQANTWNIVTE